MVHHPSESVLVGEQSSLADVGAHLTRFSLGERAFVRSSLEALLSKLLESVCTHGGELVQAFAHLFTALFGDVVP
jgi:hypothetical protein